MSSKGASPSGANAAPSRAEPGGDAAASHPARRCAARPKALDLQGGVEGVGWSAARPEAHAEAPDFPAPGRDAAASRPASCEQSGAAPADGWLRYQAAVDELQRIGLTIAAHQDIRSIEFKTGAVDPPGDWSVSRFWKRGPVTPAEQSWRRWVSPPRPMAGRRHESCRAAPGRPTAGCALPPA